MCVCDGVALVATVAIGDQLDYRREGRGMGGRCGNRVLLVYLPLQVCSEQMQTFTL